MPSNYEPPDRITWDDPGPGKARKGSKWDPIAAQLKARPGEWACIGRNIQTSMVTAIRRGGIKCFAPAGSFEVVTRNHTERWRADIYVRYVGEPKSN